MSDAAARQHHPFSPSKLNYLEASPLFTNRDESPSEASLAGTAQHEAVDAGDFGDLEDVQAEAVAACLNFWDSIVAKYPGGTVLAEEYLPVDDEVLVFQGKKWAGTSAGYLDRSVISKEQIEAEIVDWKFGQWSVEPAETNLQGIAYVLGLVHRFPTLQKVTVHFVLPHRDELDSHTFTRDDFPAMLTRVRLVVARAKKLQEEADLSKCSATNSTCMFCGNIGACPLIAALALKVGKKFSPLKVPQGSDVELFQDPKRAGEALDIAGVMGAWSKGVRSVLTNRAITDAGWIPEGYTLKQRSDTEVLKTAAAIELAIAYGADPDVLEEKVWRFGLSPLLKVVRDAAERGRKDAREVAFRDHMLKIGISQKEPPITFLEKIKS